MKILKIRELLRASTGKPPPLNTKTMRKSTELIESFVFCGLSPLNSRNSQQGSSVKLRKFRKNQQKFSIFMIFKIFMIFQGFHVLGWSGLAPLLVLGWSRGGRGRLGIGPQGRQSVPRHFGRSNIAPDIPKVSNNITNQSQNNFEKMDFSTFFIPKNQEKSMTPL